MDPGKQRAAVSYLEFCYARREDLSRAYPGASGLIVRRTRNPLKARDQARAEELQAGWSTLDCFGFTEQELDALGVALGIPRRPDRPTKLAPEEQARVIEALGGSVPNPAELPRTVAGTHFDPALVISDACLVVYPVPRAFRERLASKGGSASTSDHARVPRASSTLEVLAAVSPRRLRCKRLGWRSVLGAERSPSDCRQWPFESPTDASPAYRA